jgi:hypothetical protein
MKALFDGIEAEYTGTALDTATTGIWHIKAPETATMPYVTYLVLGNIPDYSSRTAGPQVCENVRVQISVWTPGWDADDCLTLVPLLTAVYDDCVLAVTGYHSISMTRAADNLIAGPDGGWQYAAEYEVSIQEV